MLLNEGFGRRETVVVIGLVSNEEVAFERIRDRSGLISA